MSLQPLPRSSVAPIVGAVVLAPLVVRLLLLFEERIALRTADLQGLIADVGVSLLLASALIAASRHGRATRLAGTLCVGFWCLSNFANYEHIRELGSMAGLSHAGFVIDRTFFHGSVLAPTHPLLLVFTALVSMALAWLGTDPDRPRSPRGPLLIGLALFVAAVVIPQTDEIARWRQSDFLSAQALRLLAPAAALDVQTAIEHTGLATRDLDGTSVLKDGPKARNVLLVILEGVSGAYLPAFREYHGRAPLLEMPELDLVARQGLSYPSFVATQRQTNRGEYALLCGEYPKLLTAEANMSQLAGKGPLECLPAILRDAGFSTHYLQAAPIAFMMKDQFMPQAGFEEVRGDAWFKKAYNRNHWGVDDRAFFEASFDKIRELEGSGKPWFLTLLTVGTHHRYNVPPSFEGNHEAGSPAWAFEYLDQSVAAFLRQLEAAGVLDDTLVLITSDESQAKHAGASDVTNLVTQGWGFLIALLPSGDRGVVDEVFVQPDLPLSVVDYLDLDTGRQLFNGRSVFRRYRSPREVYWGNTYLGMVAGLTLDNLLVTCTEDFTSCAVRPVDGASIFSPDVASRAATGDEIEWLRTAANGSVGSIPGLPRDRRFTLISPGLHPIESSLKGQYLFGGQFVFMPARTTAHVEIEVEATGASGWVDLVQLFVVNMRPRYSREVRIRAGETLHLSYSVNTEVSLENVECRLWIMDFDGAGIGLDFSSAELELAPLSSPRLEAEVVEHEFEVTGRRPE